MTDDEYYNEIQIQNPWWVNNILITSFYTQDEKLWCWLRSICLRLELDERRGNDVGP